jgi:predicted GNAT family acetyltransferase
VLLANPDALELPDGNVIDGRTRLALTSDGTGVGFATGIPYTDSGLELEDLFVDPDYRRRGIARALMVDLAAAVRRNGLTHIAVTANPHADLFYREVGFVAVGHAQTEFGSGARMLLEISGESAARTGQGPRLSTVVRICDAQPLRSTSHSEALKPPAERWGLRRSGRASDAPRRRSAPSGCRWASATDT